MRLMLLPVCCRRRPRAYVRAYLRVTFVDARLNKKKKKTDARACACLCALHADLQESSSCMSGGRGEGEGENKSSGCIDPPCPAPPPTHSRHLNPLSSPLLFICCHSPPSSQAMFSSLCPCPRCSFTPPTRPSPSTPSPPLPFLCLYLTSFAVIGQVSCVHPPPPPSSLPLCLPPSLSLME